MSKPNLYNQKVIAVESRGEILKSKLSCRTVEEGFPPHQQRKVQILLGHWPILFRCLLSLYLTCATATQSFKPLSLDR